MDARKWVAAHVVALLLIVLIGVGCTAWKVQHIDVGMSVSKSPITSVTAGAAPSAGSIGVPGTTVPVVETVTESITTPTVFATVRVAPDRIGQVNRQAEERHARWLYDQCENLRARGLLSDALSTCQQAYRLDARPVYRVAIGEIVGALAEVRREEIQAENRPE